MLSYCEKDVRGRLPNKAFRCIPPGRKKRDRPKKRCLCGSRKNNGENIPKDLWENRQEYDGV